ncbi:HpcH/HpaI aldolase/citrate lyase family protein [Woeseia oceani]|uniref:Citrate lyase n=1 Tax=Woeseia oceani TaxID=1548547 RepID=A0A193LEH3_9GAMM|nr:CoA ester lyase [Woeseia oceani]ANO50863.1 citrate lyase [Woeseia oceani]
MNRSYLFVPGDSERKLAKARDSGADALIVDLEDSVAPNGRPAARRQAGEFLADRAVQELWLRINPLDSEDALLDLRAAFPGAPHGIVLPKANGASDIARLDDLLNGFEAEHGLPMGQTKIMPLVTERPEALFRLHEYAGSSERLAAMSWGGEDLSAAVGATRNRDEHGNWLAPYELARSLCLFGAAAAGVDAVDTVFTNFRDVSGLASYAAAARRDGFSGMLAIHPAQVAAINAAFTPGKDEIQRAQRIVALFADSPDAGALGLDGEMLDRPHLLQAERLLRLVSKLN